MTEELLRELIQEVEELAERHADDRRDCRAMGSSDGELACLKHERSTRSTLRRARKALLKMFSQCGTCKSPISDCECLGPNGGSIHINYDEIDNEVNQ